MKRAFLIVLFWATTALAGDRLEQQLAKRELLCPRPPADQTLAQALATLSADYHATYHEQLHIYLAVDLAQPPEINRPHGPAPKIPGLDPISEADSSSDTPASARINGGPLRVPVIECLRYLTSLAGVAYTIRDDIILVHAKTN